MKLTTLGYVLGEAEEKVKSLEDSLYSINSHVKEAQNHLNYNPFSGRSAGYGVEVIEWGNHFLEKASTAKKLFSGVTFGAERAANIQELNRLKNSFLEAIAQVHAAQFLNDKEAEEAKKFYDDDISKREQAINLVKAGTERLERIALEREKASGSGFGHKFRLTGKAIEESYEDPFKNVDGLFQLEILDFLRGATCTTNFAYGHLIRYLEMELVDNKSPITTTWQLSDFENEQALAGKLKKANSEYLKRMKRIKELDKRLEEYKALKERHAKPAEEFVEKMKQVYADMRERVKGHAKDIIANTARKEIADMNIFLEELNKAFGEKGLAEATFAYIRGQFGTAESYISYREHTLGWGIVQGGYKAIAYSRGSLAYLPFIEHKAKEIFKQQ